MTPHSRRRFYSILEELWRRKLLSAISNFIPSPGKQAKFTKTFREDRIEGLDDLIGEAYIPYFR